MALDLLVQVSGHGEDIVKSISPLDFDNTDADQLIEAFDQVSEEVQKFPGPMWKVGFPPGESSSAIGGASVPKDRQ